MHTAGQPLGQVVAGQFGVAEGLDEQVGEGGVREAVVHARAVPTGGDQVYKAKHAQVTADGALKLSQELSQVMNNLFSPSSNRTRVGSESARNKCMV